MREEEATKVRTDSQVAQGPDVCTPPEIPGVKYLTLPALGLTVYKHVPFACLFQLRLTENPINKQ